MASDWSIGEVVKLATAFLEGNASALETAVAIHNVLHWDDAPKELQSALLTVTGVVSETDDIPLGKQRGLWHADVRAGEDQKHDQAQLRATPLMTEACEQILAGAIVR